MATEHAKHKWEFRARFRRGAFGWRSDTPIKRIKEALAEIKAAEKHNPVLAGEGAVLLLERISPALEHVDGSSGAIGNAVYSAIEQLVPLIAKAPANSGTRRQWLERLYEAHAADDMPYIESLGGYWGELCVSPDRASEWADLMLPVARRVLGPRRRPGDYFHGTEACLSSLLHAGRHDELLELLSSETFWPYRRWAARALVAMGRKAEAIRYAESCRGPYASDAQIDRFCEEVLLSSGLVEEAYRRYGLRAHQRSTYLATYRAVAAKYPHVEPATLLADLAATTPGQEGKWFAAAKGAGLYEEALELARKSATDPKVLSRAARDFAQTRPEFALESGILALRWLAAGYGYEVAEADIRSAVELTLAVAAQLDLSRTVGALVLEMVDRERPSPQGQAISQEIKARVEL